MARKKTMRLQQERPAGWFVGIDGMPEWIYRVMEVDNSTEPPLWMLLTKEQVDAYCDDESWTVKIRIEERL